MEILESLRDALENGFISRNHPSLADLQPQLVVNRPSENKKVMLPLLKELRRCRSFSFSVAFLTMGGYAVLANTLEELRQKGISGRILVSQYQNFTQPEALRKLVAFQNIDLRIATKGNFHAKCYLFDHGNHYNMIIGSSNLTDQALTSNKEWNLRIAGSQYGKIVQDALKEFNLEFEEATKVTSGFLQFYQSIYVAQIRVLEDRQKELEVILGRQIRPNKMQKSALMNLQKLRQEGKDRALLISATGTGKTYLSAFDVATVKPKRMLFLVHRANIANKARESFQRIMPNQSYGMFSGQRKEVERDYLFSTIQTVSRDENLYAFAPDHFEYIVMDETHRAGAETYQKILRHLKPKFLLGMTATPERTDGFDIFNQFEYNIAAEIRLHRALEEDMLCHFHYFGVTDVTIEDQTLESEAAFLKLVSEERINHIIQRSQDYGCDTGVIRGLVFCNSNKVSAELSKGFNERGFKTVALSGLSSEREREEAIERIESDDPKRKLDYIFTVDIFNEGVDIPRINQIIMLRPTHSAIIFVQQLGRGLRKTEGKDYLTVIDFIGNYDNNFLVPIALYGDSSYNKDNLRKLLAGESEELPGASTVHFEKIARERIYTALDKANMSRKRDLVNDYSLLKYKLGRPPMMLDFLEHGSRDAYLYVEASRSYFNFVEEREEILRGVLSLEEKRLLEYLSRDVANAKRVEESLLLRALFQKGQVTVGAFLETMEKVYGYRPSEDTLESLFQNINLRFVTENQTYQGKGHKASKVSVGEKYSVNIIEKQGDRYLWTPSMKAALAKDTFQSYLKDLLDYSIKTYNQAYDPKRFHGGFILYKKYSRKDVFRILNWVENPVAQNVGGYIISGDKSNCPIFVNYHKEEEISETTKYEDAFVNESLFTWFSKSKRKLNSPDVQAILNHRQNQMRIPLFIKKNNDEGMEFYYMGDLSVIEGQAQEEQMPVSGGKAVSVVKMLMRLAVPVEQSLYQYLTEDLT